MIFDIPFKKGSGILGPAQCLACRGCRGAATPCKPRTKHPARSRVYDIDVRGRSRRLLDEVSGWAIPGTLTALMGVSRAGKTTLLDALAKRLSIGVVGGDLSMNGKPVGISFQRQIGKTP